MRFRKRGREFFPDRRSLRENLCATPDAYRLAQTQDRRPGRPGKLERPDRGQCRQRGIFRAVRWLPSWSRNESGRKKRRVSSIECKRAGLTCRLLKVFETNAAEGQPQYKTLRVSWCYINS